MNIDNVPYLNRNELDRLVLRQWSTEHENHLIKQYMAACQNAKETLDLLKEPHTDSWKERAQLVSLHLHQ